MSRYVFTEDMREISGFGGMSPSGAQYEECCRAMIVAGLEWFDAHPDADPRFKTYKRVVGVCAEDNADAKALSKAMCAPAEEKGGATGAMHQAAVAHVLRARAIGWDAYVTEMRGLKREEERHARVDLAEYDDVIVTGRIVSEPGAPHVERLRGVVAAVTADRVKVWPLDEEDPKLPKGHDGKLWFSREDASFEIVRRGSRVSHGLASPSGARLG